MQIQITLEDIARRLNRPVPPQYESFVRASDMDSLNRSMAAPAEVCARNLEERGVDGLGASDCGFVLCATGDGNFWAIGDGADELARLWSHESRALTDTAVSIAELLEAMAQSPIPEVVAHDNNYVLSRVDPPSQAILNPCTPEDLLLVSQTLEAVEYFDSLQLINPFAQEPFQLRVFGLTLGGDSRNARLELSSGALLTRNCTPMDVNQVAEIARLLQCHVFPAIKAD